MSFQIGPLSLIGNSGLSRLGVYELERLEAELTAANLLYSYTNLTRNPRQRSVLKWLLLALVYWTSTPKGALVHTYQLDVSWMTHLMDGLTQGDHKYLNRLLGSLQFQKLLKDPDSLRLNQLRTNGVSS